MSLIPYSQREGREIVLRHRDALVVRDPSSKRLEIRGLNIECPTCHQPLRPASPDRQFDHRAQAGHDAFIDPDYFRMLRAGHQSSHADRPPPSPIRRLVQPIPLPSGRSSDATDADEVEFVSSTPDTHNGTRIRREAFQPNYFKDFFVEERELGRGGKGVVLLVRHEIDGYALGHFACKRVPVGDNHAWLEKVLIEVELLAKLSHPNLVSYRHVWLEDVQLTRFGPSVACAFILQQYCNSGDLLHYIIGDQPQETTKEQLKAQMRRRSKGQLDRPKDMYPAQRRLGLDEIYSLFKDITSGLAYLHAANYIHRDLKPSNCLLHREGSTMVCLISDFGEVQPENMVRKSTGSTGTISYCAPEVLQKDARGRYGNFSTKSDIFSLGMILYFLCFGCLPYQNANTVQEELEDIDLLRAEISGWKGFQEERRERPDLPARLYHLLKKLLALNPAERPSASEVLVAMKSESGLDAMPGRSSSPHLHHRIQSLDSPMPPSTPVADPKKKPRSGSLDERDKSNGLLVHDGGTARYRAHAMAPSHSQDGQSRPQHELAQVPRSSSPQETVQLLMPPPTTLASEVQHRAMIGWMRIVRATRSHHDAIRSGTRLVLFTAKMATLARPCWPYMVNLTVAAPLVALAALDLQAQSIGSIGRGPEATRRGWNIRVSLGLACLHWIVIWATARLGGLCAARLDQYW